MKSYKILKLEQALCKYRVTDKIQFVAESVTSALVAQNSGLQKGQGLELEDRYELLLAKRNLFVEFHYHF